MREGLIRLTGEKDIFYDSIEKVYRYRMHCPQCGEVIKTCRCYQDLERLESDISDGIADYTCSSKCALLCGEWDDIDEAMQSLDLSKDLRTCLSQISEEILKEELNGYSRISLLMKLIQYDSEMPINHIKKLTKEEMLDLLMIMGDGKDILWRNNISYYPDIKDLTEEDARKILNILTEDGDFDMPGGEECTI